MKEVGEVKWFNENFGYGFINRKDGSNVFVHYKDIKMDGFKTLTLGEPVSFDVENGPKGLCAKNVERINKKEI